MIINYGHFLSRENYEKDVCCMKEVFSISQWCSWRAKRISKLN